MLTLLENSQRQQFTSRLLLRRVFKKFLVLGFWNFDSKFWNLEKKFCKNSDVINQSKCSSGILEHGTKCQTTCDDIRHEMMCSCWRIFGPIQACFLKFIDLPVLLLKSDNFKATDGLGTFFSERRPKLSSNTAFCLQNFALLRNNKDWKRMCLGNNVIWWSRR